MSIERILLSYHHFKRDCQDSHCPNSCYRAGTWQWAEITEAIETQPFYIQMKAFLTTRSTVPVSRAHPWVQINPTSLPVVDRRHMPHVVVVGGGVSGLSAAAAMNAV